MSLQNSINYIQDVKRLYAHIPAIALAVAAAGISGFSYAQDAATALGPKPPAPITSAPPLNINPLVAPPQPGVAPDAPAAQAVVQPGIAPATAPGALDAEGAPWVLKAESRPMPLRYRDALPMSSLYLDLPTEAEARLMLPGRAADSVDHNRSVVSKFVTDAIGVAAQARGRQQDALESWITQTENQRHLLQQDPWSLYQFSLESRRELSTFRASVEAQTAPSVTQMVDEVKRAITQLAPLVSAMPTYELQKSMYNLMVQLKEGVSLYQTQVVSGDRETLARIDAYLDKYPPVTRPAGNPPSVEQLTAPAVKQREERLPAPAMMAVQQPLEPAASAEPQKDSGDTFGGLLVVGGIFAAALVLLARMRKRKTAAAPSEK